MDKNISAMQPTGDLTDEQIRDAVQGIYLSDYQDNPEGYDIAIARAAIAAYLARQAQAPKEPAAPDAMRQAIYVLRAAIEAQISPDWECNSDHPALQAALNATKRFAGPHLAEVAPAGAQNEDILALHRQLTAEKLRADQGWARAVAKSKECIELRDRMAGAQNAEAIRNQAIGEGLEMAARHLDKQRQAVDQDHAYQEPDTGAWVFDRPETEEYSNTLAELAEEIRALKAQTGSANTLNGGDK